MLYDCMHRTAVVAKPGVEKDVIDHLLSSFSHRVSSAVEGIEFAHGKLTMCHHPGPLIFLFLCLYRVGRSLWSWLVLISMCPICAGCSECMGWARCCKCSRTHSPLYTRYVFCFEASLSEFKDRSSFLFARTPASKLLLWSVKADVLYSRCLAQTWTMVADDRGIDVLIGGMRRARGWHGKESSFCSHSTL
jgi:hypothetical protein